MFTRLILIILIALPVGLIQPTFASAASEGDLVRCPDFSAVYYIARDGSRWVFPHEKIYFTWYDNFDDVILISCPELASHPIGKNVPYQAGTRLIKVQSAPTVYAVSPGGALHAIGSEARAIELFGADWAKRVDDLSDAFFPYYVLRSAVSNEGYPDGTILRNADTGTYYYMNENVRRQVSTSDLSQTLKQYALVRSAPFSGTTSGEAITSSEWQDYRALDQAASALTVVETPAGDLAAPVLSVGTATIANGERYELTWTDPVPSDQDVIFELQEDTTFTFSSPDLLLNEKDTAWSLEKESQENPNFHYRVRATDGEVFSAWSNTVSVNILNHVLLEGTLDTSLPISNSLGFTSSTSASVPIAAASILHYLDQVVKRTDALGISAGKTVKTLADYLAWMMDLNGEGNDARLNTTIDGVYHADIKPALDEFIRWDGSHPAPGFNVPEALSNKTGYNSWTVKEIRAGTESTSGAFAQVANSLKAGVPVLGVFQYWNPVATGAQLDEIHFYEFFDNISESGDAQLAQGGSVPTEYWLQGAANAHAGHGVTVVGYIPDYDETPDDGTNDKQDYVIVNDGWSATFPLVAIPLEDWARFFVITPASSTAPQSETDPDMVSSVQSGELVNVSWSSVAKATYYEVQWDTDPDFGSPDSYKTEENDGELDFVNTHSVSTTTVFYYRVRAWNAFGSGDWGHSATLTVTP